MHPPLTRTAYINLDDTQGQAEAIGTKHGRSLQILLRRSFFKIQTKNYSKPSK